MEPLSAVFAGRDQELRLLEQMLSASGGSPSFLVGPSGIGKTALCHAYEHFRRENYSGSVFCSAAQFGSPEALLDFIDFQRGQIVDRVSVPQAGLDRDSRVLVVVDDLDRFSDQEASYLLTMLHARSPYCVSLCTSRQRFQFLAISETPSLELRLGPLPQSALAALLANRIAAAGGDHANVEQFLSALARQGLQPYYLTPRIVLHLFSSYLTSGDLPRAIAELSARGIGASNLVVFEHEGRLRAAPVLQGTPSGIIAPSRPPLYAAPYVVIPHLGAIWHGQLEEFEAPLAAPNSNEETFQQFFESNPHFLQGIEYGRVVAHPSLIREGDGPLIPDFMLQPLGLNYADILDLKRPDGKLVTGRKDRRRFAQGVHEAIAQVREYRAYFERSEYRKAVQERYGLTAYRPAALIVIGRQPEAVSAEEMKRIAEDTPAFVKVQTYDDVLRKMRRMVELTER